MSSNPIYRESVARHFAALKQSRRLDEIYVKGIFLPRSGGFLVPLCELHASDSGAISDLSKWHSEDEGTTAWVQSVLHAPDNVLFFVVDRFGNRIGHAGFANCWNDRGAMEVDNVVRGVKGADAGIMSEALRALLDWAWRVICPDSICLRVPKDNEHAIRFLERLGFVPDGSDRHFLSMRYQPPAIAGDELILTAGPTVTAREAWYTLDAARNGWREHWSDYLDRFQHAFEAYLGVRHAIPTSSCTGALHIALMALGIGPGDEVIVPDLTWVATANAVRYTGATPVFADVEDENWCLDPDDLQRKISPRTRAIIPVHLYGQPARLDAICEIADRHRLFLIEDAAPAVGAEFRNRKIGTFGDFPAFSFQGAKLVVTGEGGMLVTDDDELYRKALIIADQGRRPGTFWIDTPGVKYKLSNLQAAFGLAQLERVDELIEAKRRIFSWYEEDLAGLSGLRFQRECAHSRGICWMTSVEFDESIHLTRDEIREALRARNVDTRPVFPSISQYPIWNSVQEAPPISARISQRALNLPSGTWLSRAEVQYVARSLIAVLRP